MKWLGSTTLALALGILLLLGVVSYRSLLQMTADADRVIHTHDVLVAIGASATSLAEVDSARRGYVLTGEERYRAALGRAKEALVQGLRELRRLTADNPRQQSRLDALDRTVAARLELAARSIEVRDAHPGDVEALSDITRQGADLGDRIRDLLGEMRSEEQDLLMARAQAAQRSSTRTLRLIPVASGVAVVLLLGAGLLYRRERARRQSAEVALRTSEERLRIAVTGAGIGTWHWDILTESVSWSDECCRLCGLPPGSPMDRERFQTLVHPEDRDRVRKAVDEAVARGTDYDCEYRIFRPDGTLRWVAARGTLVRDPEGRPTAMLGILMDLTERKGAEEAIRSYAEEVRDLFDNAPCGYHSLDSDGVFLRVNETELRWLGYGREELVGRKRFPELLTPEGQTLFEELFPVLKREGGIRDVEVDLVRKDGSRLPALISATTVEDAAGRFLVTRSIVFDATERRRADEQLREVNRQLAEESRRAQETTRLKSEFLANMSHELRTPLNAVIGFAELIHDGKAGPLTADQKEYLGDILTSGRHLLQLINDVLDLAKVESGKMEFSPEPTDLAKLMAELRDLLRTLSARKRLRVELEVEPGLGPARVDPARLKQVLYNYLSNAIKFTPEEGRIVLRARAESAEAFRVEVEDTGVGIPPEDLPKLFTEFHQLEGGAAKRHQGTGLGLALTKRIVEAQGGRVGVDSTPGRGSLFYAVLPHQAAQAAAEETVAARAGAPPGSGPRVLVVEDDAKDREWLVHVLEDAGFRVDTATTGREALERCALEAYAAVTLDLILPDMSGWEALHAIRENGPSREAAVVVVTVVSEKEAGAGFRIQDHLVKPISAGELLASLGRAGVAPGRERPILVVDDDPKALKLVEKTLGSVGYRPLCHADGESALRAAAEDPPAAVVLDLLMPRMDGFEFLDRFRAMPEGRDTPVVVWTNKDLTAEEQSRLRAMAQRVVQKSRGGAHALVEEIRACAVSEGEGKK